jgi:hypothetical protein
MSFDGNDDPSSAQPVPNHSELEVGAKPKPVSARKLAANRANAARSTGPRTAEGKARVAMNALRHGLASHTPLLPGEEPAELDALATAYQNDLRPRGALERELVARVVGIAWRLRRVARAEEAMWEEQHEGRIRNAQMNAALSEAYKLPKMPWQTDGEPAPKAPGRFLADQFSVMTKVSPLERLAMYEQRLSRGLHAAIREFNALRKQSEGRDEEDDDADCGNVASAQNKPAHSESPRPTDSPQLNGGPEAAPAMPTDAADGTGGRIEQNKPTAGPSTPVGGLGEVVAEVMDVSDGPTMSPVVDAPDARPHPPSP